MMKKLEAKTGIFVRSLATRQSSTQSQSSNGIIIHLYDDVNSSNSEHIQEFGKTFDAEQLCYRVVEKLEITPLVAPLFALAHPSLELWCPPNEKILCSEDCAREFVLRLRFIPPAVIMDKLPQIDSKMFNYLFQQIRNDFINDRITYGDKSMGQEHLLGLGVIDMVRYGKQHEINLAELLKLEPKHFIPSSAKNRFSNFVDKTRLHWNFKPHLEQHYKEYEKNTFVNTQLTYIKGIAGYAEHYGMEVFRIARNGSRSEEIVAQVKPYDNKFPGLNIYQGKVVQTVLHFLYVTQHFCWKEYHIGILEMVQLTIRACMS